MNSTYVLYSQPYLDKTNEHYKNIVTINLLPIGPLSNFIQKIYLNPLSKFKEPRTGQKCAFALKSLYSSKLMIVDEVPDLFGFLLSNGYTIDTRITKMMNQSDIRFQTENANQIICFITYVS
jgi:hypothetical protein